MSQLTIYNPDEQFEPNTFFQPEEVIFRRTGTNKYTTTLSDHRHQTLSNFVIKQTSPEVRGKGRVSFVKNFAFILIKELTFTIVNRDGSKEVLPSLSGYDLYRYKFDTQPIIKYNQRLNDRMCKTRQGKYMDSIIFPKQDIHVHLKLPYDIIPSSPNTQIEVDLELNSMEKVLCYNSEFLSSLPTFINEASISSKNLTLQYYNYSLAKMQDVQAFNLSRTIGDSGSSLIATNNHTSVLRMYVYAKPHTLQTSQEYLMNPENISCEEKLKKRAIDNFKNDLIKTENTLQKNSKIKYIEIPESGEIKFKKTANTCKITILNKPEDVKFFFHSNILSYSRRSDTLSATNISEMMREIEVLYTEEKLIIDVKEHHIPLELLCVPISFWTDITNTSAGDLRSEESKKNDFFYENPFINSIDFLDYTNLIDSVTVVIPDKQMTYEANQTLPSVFSDLPGNIYDILLAHPNKPIKNIPHHFERFNVKLLWKSFPYQAIFQLYKLIPIVELLERYKICFTHDRFELKKSPF